MKRAYVETTKGQIHYRHKAGTGTPIVCLHQTASSSAMFEAFAAAYDGPEPVYALDTPGFGGSFEPDGLPPMLGYADDLSAAIDALGIGPVHLFGHHTGASIGVEMATRRPDLAASFSMIGPVVTEAEERDFFSSIYPKDFAPAADGSHLDRMWEYVGELGGQKNLALRHREVIDTARAWQGHIKVYTKIWEQDFTALYKQVQCPMLIMCSQQDVLWTLFERAKDLRPDAMAAEIPGSNFQTDEAPHEVATALKTFLTTL
jgi:pimeloyl-ACP methyl ester carboxylesterase